MEQGSIWYYESEAPRLGVRVGFAVRNVLRNLRTPYQHLMILETEDFGNMMVLDDCVMLCDRDEFIYHEMLTHVALFTHPAPRRVLVVGGGDGGTLREIARHRGVETMTLCEIDGEVIRAARDFFPALATGFDDPRVTILVKDAIELVHSSEAAYDVILVDSTDPVGPATGLYREEFYVALARALAPDGIMVAQGESPYLHRATVRTVHQNLRKVFPHSGLYQAFIPTYPSGWWSFAYGSKRHDPLSAEALARSAKAAFPTRYYTSEVHRAAFALPPFVRELLP